MRFTTSVIAVDLVATQVMFSNLNDMFDDTLTDIGILIRNFQCLEDIWLVHVLNHLFMFE